MTMRAPPADRELEILRYVSAHAPITARDVAERFGEANGLARTTVVTLMERLRKKGYLSRRRREGVYHYSPRVSQAEVLDELVRRFFERTLGVSVSPVIAYLTRTRDLSDEEADQLERWVEELRARREDGS